MKIVLPVLTPGEESALRLVRDGGEDLIGGTVQVGDLHRLLVLQLIDWDGRSWRLTDLGNECAQMLFGVDP
jgi:hypothetical protein